MAGRIMARLFLKLLTDWRLDDGERAAFLASLDKIAHWVNGGYRDAVSRKFPEAHAPSALSQPMARPQSPARCLAVQTALDFYAGWPDGRCIVNKDF